ncbi:hypothetical protein MHW47_08940 [Streptomyces sp. OfavH-34-F]|uniref:hypothetical protein n=1 Tax=Streptomyces sp. OfavH-34-F TaxID=2917760 RepID=UPI001EF365DA|nr:hypothetical protein [Streptomyces sp. OfavH-34-F]MCG7524560.1 hypothetical protein [Streptomyces sp. OfavH-34-F]
MTHTDPRNVPGWPLVEILLTPEGAATVNGSPVPVSQGGDPRATALAQAAGTAARLGRPVRTRLTDTDGDEWLIALAADGTESVLTAPAQKPGSRRSRRRAVASKRTAEREPGGPAAGAPRPAPPGPADIENRLGDAVGSQNWAEALRICEELVRAAAPADTDRALEAQARITGLACDHAAAYARFRDLADRRLASLGPAHPDTVSAAEAAQEQWARLGPEQAGLLSGEVFALRTRIPGPDGRGAAHARRHLLGLHTDRTRSGSGEGK